MDKYPLMELVLTLYDPHFQCKADRLLVIFHFLLVQNGFRVVDVVRQGTHETLHLTKDDQNSIKMVYMKNGKSIHALHEIAAGRPIPADRETTDALPIVENYLYSISMIFDGKQALGEFIIDNYLVEQTPTYSSTAGVTGRSSIVVVNLDDFVTIAQEIITRLDSFIEDHQNVNGIDSSDGASIEHH